MPLFRLVCLARSVVWSVVPVCLHAVQFGGLTTVCPSVVQLVAFGLNLQGVVVFWSADLGTVCQHDHSAVRSVSIGPATVCHHDRSTVRLVSIGPATTLLWQL